MQESAAVPKKREVEGGAVVMEKGAVRGQCAGKCLQQYDLLRRPFGKPLAEAPFAAGAHNRTDHIDTGCRRGQSGGLDVKPHRFRVADGAVSIVCKPGLHHGQETGVHKFG